jgi:hypothetical protein
VIIYKPSIFVVPEFAYNKADPNKIKHELKPKAAEFILLKTTWTIY